MTLAYNDVSPYWVWVTNGSAMHKISSKLTLTDTFNLDLELSSRTFSLDTSLIMII